MITEEQAAFSAQNGHAHCLLCGGQNPWSLKLTFQSGDDGTVKAKFKGDFRLQGYEDILHGGVIAALLDAAMTHCLFHHGVQGLTGDLHVRFIQPVPCCAALDLKAWVLSITPPLYRLKSELVCEERVVAWPVGKFMQQGVSQ